jgi:hypothetical protein
MSYEPRPRPRPIKAVLDEQRQDAERDRAQRQPAPKPAADTVSPAKSTAVAPGTKAATPAVPDNRTSVQQYLDEHVPVTLIGRVIRADKEHVFVTPDDGAPVPDDVDFIALVDQTMIGLIRFNGEGSPPDQLMGLLYDGFRMPQRNALGDLDSSKWEVGLDGKLQDPWRHFNYLVLQRGDTGEMFTYTTASVTGRRAVGNLLRHYDRLQKTHPDMYPVVCLKTGGFNHRDPRVGWVQVPVFAVVGRHPKDDAAKPDSSPAADMSDQIPF